ncbi:unnamed protein product [Camellia sinensis]
MGLRKGRTLGNIIMSGKAEAEGNEPINEQAVANIYGAMRSNINQIYSKITKLEMEASEHSLVMNAIKPLDPSRRCYRMIGGVLVERTIKEVLPVVQRNKEGLEEVIARLNEALEKKKKEVADFEAKYKIRIRKSDEVQDDAGRKEGSAQGVLVGPADFDLVRRRQQSTIACLFHPKYKHFKSKSYHKIDQKQNGESQAIVVSNPSATNQNSFITLEKYKEQLMVISEYVSRIEVDLLRGQKSDKVDVTLQLEELEIMNNVLHAKYEEARRRRSCVVSGRISVTWLPRMRRRGNGKCRKRMENRRKMISRIMSGKAEAEGNEPINEQAVANIYGAMRSDINQIYSKITELEMEASEHSLVMNAIKPLDPSRRCYRMIGGVLVERTIKEVLPAVQRNKEGLEEVIARLNEALEKKKKEVADFEAKYKIRIRKSDEVQDDAGRKEGSAQGVLVGPADFPGKAAGVRIAGQGAPIEAAPAKKGCEREVSEAANGVSDELKGERIIRLSWALVHSKQPEDMQHGIAMLEDPCQKLNNSSLAASLANSGSHCKRGKSFIFLLLGITEVVNIEGAGSLQNNIAPDWMQALTLKKTLDDQITKDGLIGIGITATVVGLVAGGIAASLG